MRILKDRKLKTCQEALPCQSLCEGKRRPFPKDLEWLDSIIFTVTCKKRFFGEKWCSIPGPPVLPSCPSWQWTCPWTHLVWYTDRGRQNRQQMVSNKCGTCSSDIHIWSLWCSLQWHSQKFLGPCKPLEEISITFFRLCLHLRPKVSQQRQAASFPRGNWGRNQPQGNCWSNVRSFSGVALTPPPPEITGEQNKQPWRRRFADSSQGC